jgi:hypothetical protein
LNGLNDWNAFKSCAERFAQLNEGLQLRLIDRDGVVLNQE